MKKSLVALSCIALALSFTSVALAAGPLDEAQRKLNNALANPANPTGLSPSIETTTATVVKGALTLVGTIFLVLMVYAGILWMTASGREEQIETAKKIITAAVIGLFITLSAYAITSFVAGQLGGS